VNPNASTTSLDQGGANATCTSPGFGPGIAGAAAQQGRTVVVAARACSGWSARSRSWSSSRGAPAFHDKRASRRRRCPPRSARNPGLLRAPALAQRRRPARTLRTLALDDQRKRHSLPDAWHPSCTNRAPVMTRSPPDRLASQALGEVTQPSVSGGAAVCSTTSPASLIRPNVKPAPTQIQSSVQHTNGSPRARSSVTRRACHRGGRLSSQSNAAVAGGWS
jgi:hypothetical protein